LLFGTQIASATTNSSQEEKNIIDLFKIAATSF